MTRPDTENGANGAGDDVTPVEIPAARVARGVMPDKSAPVAVDSVDTGPIRKQLSASYDGGDSPSAHEIATALVSLMGKGGPGGGSGGPPIDLKKFRKGNWLVQLLIGLVIAASGTLAAYKATETRSKTNETEVKKNKRSIEANAEAIDEVKDSVDDVGQKMDTSYRVQVRLVESVEKLTEEQKTAREKSLKEENERLRERLRERRPHREP